MSFRLANLDGRATLVAGDACYDLHTVSGGALGPDPMAAVAAFADLSAITAQLGAHAPTASLAEITLGPPVPRPSKVFAMGLNFRTHAAEAAMDVPRHPVVFTKFPSCIVGPTADVHMRSDRCDYEGELVVVIGREAKDVAQGDAWRHVAGVMVGQDISDRKVQFLAKPVHFSLGKSFDTFGPTGPVLVSVEGLANPDDLRLTTTVNGQVRQDDRTSNLVFNVPTLVAYLSRITTLVPGDLIFAGTPEGVGGPKRVYLQQGDVIVTTIEGVGTLTNRCVRASDHQLL